MVLRHAAGFRCSDRYENESIAQGMREYIRMAGRDKRPVFAEHIRMKTEARQ
jgi:hypothetical protein